MRQRIQRLKNARIIDLYSISCSTNTHHDNNTETMVTEDL